MEDNEYIKKKKDELTENIKNSEEELKELRKTCKHTDIQIKDSNPESGASHLRRVCNVCGKTLGFPTNDELRKNGYMSKWYPMQLVEEIGESLKKLDSRISTAESCTSGYISNLLTSQKGSSDYFEGALVVYSNKAKINVLGIEKELIDEYTEVSEQVARRMAERVKKIMDTEYSIATTGYADASGYGTKENPAGTIYIAISTPKGTFVKKVELNDVRNRNIYLASTEALETLYSLIKTHQALSL